MRKGLFVCFSERFWVLCSGDYFRDVATSLIKVQRGSEQDVTVGQNQEKILETHSGPHPGASRQICENGFVGQGGKEGEPVALLRSESACAQHGSSVSH